MADAAEATIRVLLADDDEEFLATLRSRIERESGLSVVGTAMDGLAAIEIADELPLDAAVVDIHMPLLDGISTVARLRHDHPDLRLIVLTGDEAPALHRAARESGADDVLLKDDLYDALLGQLRAARTGAAAGS